MENGNKTGVYYYDIWDGDKGVIIAGSYEEAVEEFKIEYPGVLISGVDAEDYDCDICSIEHIDELTGDTQLIFVEG